MREDGHTPDSGADNRVCAPDRFHWKRRGWLTMSNDFDYYDAHTGEGITDEEMHERYDDWLDELDGPINVGGLTFDASRILKELDPIAYRCGLGDYISFCMDDGEITEEPPSDDDDDEEYA